jgi:putative ABC transport system permease protein
MFRRNRRQSDFTAEIEAHVSLESDRLRSQGLSQENAEAQARRQFGNMAATAERFYESRRWMFWDRRRQDLRLAVRLLAKTPGWTSVAALTVALGIGATAAIFSIVNTVLLQPLPFPKPQQLYSIIENTKFGEATLAPDYFTMCENLNAASTQSIAQMAAYDGDTTGVNWTGADHSERLTSGMVSASFFPTLGAQPLLGRTFLPEEDRPGANRVVMLSYRLWQNKFGGDPGVVGQELRLDREPAKVIGIMPRSFDFPKGTEVWMPLALNEAQQRQRRTMHGVEIVARAHPNVTPVDVNTEIEALTQIVKNEYPHQYAGNGFVDNLRIHAKPLQERLTGRLRPALLVFAGAVGLMLLIVCFNVANLMLARATARRREIAVRIALGAPRRRIASQLFTESLTISLLGGGIGLALAVIAVHALNASRQAALAGLPQVSIDRATSLFAFLAAVLTGLIFGIVPALSSRSFGVSEALQSESRSASGSLTLRRVRQALVVAQLGLSLMLLISAGLLAKSFLQLQNTDPGFRSENILTARMTLAGPGYSTPDRRRAFIEGVLDGVRELPGVDNAAVVSGMPIGNAGNFGNLQIENRPSAPRGQEPKTGMIEVSPDYFKVLGVPLLQGRLLTGRDESDAARVVVANEAFVRQFFPGESPLGRRIMANPMGEQIWDEIVGVVGNIRQGGLTRDVSPTIYRVSLEGGSLLVHSASDPMALIPAIEKLVASIDRDQPVYDVRTMQRRLDDSLGSRRFNAVFTGCFAFIAAVLASIGVYGVMSYVVMLRTSEIGIRLALGAQPSEVLRLILREGMVLGALGSVLGIAGALSLSRFLTTLLLGVSARDTATYGVLTLLLLGVVFAASTVPGRRAAHVDPVMALRHE